MKPCPKCKQEMDYEDGTYRWNEREWYCVECGYVETEDVTGDIIDGVMSQRER